jgi:hypothetical protein
MAALILYSCSCLAQGHERQRAVHIEHTDLRAALDSVMRLYDISIVYFDDDVRYARVSASCTSCSATEALGRLLEGTDLMWIKMGEQFVLRKRPERQQPVTGNINGIVSDTLTGATIAGAMTLLERAGVTESRAIRRWCQTNAYGFYALPDIVPGDYVLEIRALGYAPQRRPVSVEGGKAIRADVPLRQMEIPMQEFTVEGHRTESTPGGGLVRGVCVRSVPSDQTQYLLDGARIYNPSHFGSVLSTFQPDLLNDVEPAINGLSPFYGGRIGGLLDLSMREGTQERLSGNAGLGSLGAHAFLEGPLSGKSTFMLSGRRAFVSPVIPFLGNKDTPSRSGSYEVIGKGNYRLTGGSRLFLSGYIGGDTYTNSMDGSGNHLENRFEWSNKNLQCRWFGIGSSSLFLFASAGYSRYDLALKHSLSGANAAGLDARPSGYKIEDVSLRAHAEDFLDESHTVRGGMELTGHWISGNVSEFALANGSFTIPQSTFWELAVYVQDQWAITNGVIAEVGARATSFMGESVSLSGVEPRFSLIAGLAADTRIYTTLTAINQFIHAYRSTGLFFYYPTLFWYPSEGSIEPTTSMQVTVGIERGWGGDAYLASVEGYYRTTHNYHGVRSAMEDGIPASVRGAFLFGDQRAFGGSLTLRKRFGSLNGSIRYTLSWLRESFEQIDNGTPFASPFGRRHELEIYVAYSPAEEWSVGAFCVLASTPSSVSGDLPVTADRATLPMVGIASMYGVDPNGTRMPGFQRLEFSIMKHFDLWQTPCQFTLRMLNAFGLLDPFDWTLNSGQNPRRAWSITMKDLKLFPLYPSLSMSVRF